MNIGEIRAGVSGRVEWEFVRRRKAFVEGDQSNLILDQGMNNLPLYSPNPDITRQPFTRWRDFLCLGSGSTLPAVTQTTLAAETHRTSNQGGFAVESPVYVRDSSGGVIRATFKMTRVVVFTAAFNITEYGFAPASSGGVSIRELFRDPAGNPITISVQPNDELQMRHYFEITLSNFAAADKTFQLAVPTDVDPSGVLTITGRATWFASDDTNAPANIFTTLWQPFDVQNNRLYAASSPTITDESPTSTAAPIPSAESTGVLATIDPYVGGSFERVKRFTMPTSVANYTHAWWVFTNSWSTTALTNGYKFKPNPAFTHKNSLRTLNLNWRTTWKRA